MTYNRWRGPTRPDSNGGRVARLTLEPNEDAPSHARLAIAELLGQTDEDVLERTTLLTSEVVTNSVKHADTDEIRIEIRPAEGSVAVLVADDGPGFAPVALPGTIADTNGGFGLPLLDTLSESWGSGYDTEAWVWFEIWPRINGASAY